MLEVVHNADILTGRTEEFKAIADAAVNLRRLSFLHDHRPKCLRRCFL